MVETAWRPVSIVFRFAESNANSSILGMQAQLWSELIASPADFEYMVFPRLLAVAERAWHKADWEQQQAGRDTDTRLSEDWTKFSNVLGHRELGRLDSKHIQYRIPPPGAR